MLKGKSLTWLNKGYIGWADASQIQDLHFFSASVHQNIVFLPKHGEWVVPVIQKCHIGRKAFTLLLPTLVVIISPSRQKLQRKLFPTFLQMMWSWSCTKPRHRAGDTGAAGRRSQAPAEQFLWHCFEENMLSHLFSPPSAKTKWFRFLRHQGSLAPTDFSWNNICVSLLEPWFHFTEVENWLQAPEYADSFLCLSSTENIRP